MKQKIYTYIDLQQGRDGLLDYAPTPQPTEGYVSVDDVELVYEDLKSLDGGTFCLREKSICLVITDRRETIDALPDGVSYMDSRHKPLGAMTRTLHTVYCGDGADVEDVLGRVNEIWAREESAALRRRRLRQTVYALKSDYDAYLYETLLTTMNDSVPDMIWYKDINGTHWRVNTAFCETVQKTKDDCRGKSHGYIWGVPEEEGFACQESEKVVIESGQTCTFDEPVKTQEGLRQYATYKTPVRSRYGDIVGTTGVGHDVTNFSNMGIEMSILVENIPIPLLLCSPEWKTMRYNAYFKEISGLDALELAMLSYQDWKASALEPVTEREMQNNGHSYVQEYRMKRGDGYATFITIEQEIRDFFDNLTGYFVIFRDITLQRSYEREILTAANTDALTGLYNRRYFYDYLRDLGAKPMTLLYMDLDRFKEVNDTYGHARGDDVLRHTADFIRECFGEGVAARLGGDEYALLLERQVAEGELDDACRALEEKVLSLFRHSEPDDLYVTISIGTVSTDGKGKAGKSFDTDVFIHEADTNMYEVKKRHHEESGTRMR